MRPYQVKALQSIQRAVKDGAIRFLFEMATGTGKTLTSAAVIKLFLRTGNARRVLFLVDRLELEDQAQKDMVAYLSKDYKSVIYKENKEDWRKAEIIITTVQSLLFNNKYKKFFSPTDFVQIKGRGTRKFKRMRGNNESTKDVCCLIHIGPLGVKAESRRFVIHC